MSNQPAASASAAADNHSGLRLLALAAVAAGVILLAAAAFVLSYSGIHAVALSAGVSPRLAKLYPLIFDAMLVVACAAVLALRSAGLPSRAYAWLSMLALLMAAATADALHATGVKLPHRPTAAVIAILPWALVLIGFGLLLCMLRHARHRRTTVVAAEQRRAVEPAGHVQMRTGIDDLLGPKTLPAEARADEVIVTAAPAPAIVSSGVRTASGSVPPPDLPAELALDYEPEPDDPASDEAAPPEPLAQVARIPRARQEAPGDDQPAAGPSSAAPLSPAAGPSSAAPLSPAAGPSSVTPLSPAAGPSSAAPLSPATGPRAKPDSAPAAGSAPAGESAPAGVSASDAGPAPDARLAPDAPSAHHVPPAADARSAPDAPPAPEAPPTADAPPAPEPGPAPDAETEPDGETTLDDETKAAAEASRQADVETQRKPGQAPLLQFDRMRSSPIPPGT